MHKSIKAITIFGLGAVVTLTIVITGYNKTAQAHCQVPCGIYDDAARIAQLEEDVVTITKAIGNINKLSGKTDATSVNQAVRWVQTKEVHASHIITVVSEYFLTQKVKVKAKDAAGYTKYLESLARHHAVMVAAMKTKQDSSLESSKALGDAVHELSHDYVEHQH